MYVVHRTKRASRSRRSSQRALRTLREACYEAHEWLSEFCDDPTDLGAQNLIKQLRYALELADKRVCQQEEAPLYHG